MIDDKVKKDRFRISADELESRMRQQQKEHNEPIQKAVALLEAALERVLEKLGVIIEDGNFQEQQDELGIIITEETRPEMAGISGFFVFKTIRKKFNPEEIDIVPYAWVGAARLSKHGECFVDIQYFQDERLEETGGFKLLH